jgi:hypothetical protein
MVIAFINVLTHAPTLLGVSAALALVGARGGDA